jgi:hypothetical protein
MTVICVWSSVYIGLHFVVLGLIIIINHLNAIVYDK